MRHRPGVQSNCALISVRRRSTPIEMEHNAVVHRDEMNTLRRKSGWLLPDSRIPHTQPILEKRYPEESTDGLPFQPLFDGLYIL